jgi:hypothetical protein
VIGMSGPAGERDGEFEDVFAQLPPTSGPPVRGDDSECDAVVLLWSVVYGAEQEVREAARMLDAVGDVLLPVERDLVRAELVAAGARLATVARTVAHASFAIGWPFEHGLWRMRQLEARGRAEETQGSGSGSDLR